jgi:hypothetical protein
MYKFRIPFYVYVANGLHIGVKYNLISIRQICVLLTKYYYSTLLAKILPQGEKR